MAKKSKIEIDVNSVLETISEIEYDLLFMLEIGVNNNICVNSDGKPIVIDGKAICYPKTLFENNFNVIKFDPFWNRKLTNYLFQRYIVMYQQENNNIHVTSFFITSDLSNPSQLFAVCRTNMGDIQSNKFTNETVCWIDLMHKIEQVQYPYEKFLEIDSIITLLRNSEVKK